MEFDKEDFKKQVVSNVKNMYRKTIDEASKQQVFQAVAYTVKDYIIDRWIATHREFEKEDAKTVYYMSMEFLMGRALGNNMINLTCYKEVKEALDELGFDLNVIEDQEPDAALGNGGLGRLAACFLDSLSTLGYPAYGCGIRYRYGMFAQKIENGYQIEIPDDWLRDGNPFEIKRPEYAVEVKFGGYVRSYVDDKGRDNFVQEGYQCVRAVPYDLPVVGYGNNIVNTLRIWDAEPIQEFNLDSFDKGDYHKAVEQENLAKTICEVLYPCDDHYAGKELRLKQQYFFVSASVQRAVAKYKETHDDVRKLYEKICFQLNDTHPTVTVAELMRILMDDEKLTWDEAWEVTNKACAYTNHTILAEALEKWPIHYLEDIVPQLVPIIRKLDEKVKAKYPAENLAIIDSNNLVHMAHMDIHYGFSINGVAALHTEILKNSELHQFYEIYPEKFNNKTNGITFRRWLMYCNQPLTKFISSLIGEGYKKDADELKKLLAYKDDQKVLDQLLEIKTNAKKICKDFVLENTGIEIDENSVFDIQIKRLHEYKRQQLNALYIIYKYLEIKDGKKPERPITFIFGAKAAPAYYIAKDIIHLLLTLETLIQNDPDVAPYMKLVMVENYNVSAAEKLIPACDISEQISLASKEASGTGNMKFMLNGAITLGTMDGANVEISDLVGKDNIYIFGESSDEIIKHYEKMDYNSRAIYEGDADIKKYVDFIVSEPMLKLGKEEHLRNFYNELLNKDWFMTLLDLKDYIKVKDQVFADYEDRNSWAKKMLVNIGEAGFFSSDRTIEQYNKDIWHLN